MIFFQGAYDSDLTGALDINSYRAVNSILNVKRNNDQTTVVPYDPRYKFGSGLDSNQGVDGFEIHDNARERAEGSEGLPRTGTDFNVYWSGPDYIQAANGISDARMPVAAEFSESQSSYPPLLIEYLRSLGLVDRQGTYGSVAQEVEFFDETKRILGSYVLEYAEGSTVGTNGPYSQSHSPHRPDSKSPIWPHSSNNPSWPPSSSPFRPHSSSPFQPHSSSPFRPHSTSTYRRYANTPRSNFTQGTNRETPIPRSGVSRNESRYSPVHDQYSRDSAGTPAPAYDAAIASGIISPFAKTPYHGTPWYEASSKVPTQGSPVLAYDAAISSGIISPFTMLYPGATRDEPSSKLSTAPISSTAPTSNFGSHPLPDPHLYPHLTPAVTPMAGTPATSASSSSATLATGTLFEHEKRLPVNSEGLSLTQAAQVLQDLADSGAFSTPAPNVPTVTSSRVSEPSSSDTGRYSITSGPVASSDHVFQVPRVIVEAPPSGAAQMLAQASTLFLAPASPGKLSRSPSSCSLAPSFASSFTSQELRVPGDDFLPHRLEKRKRRSFGLREKMGLKKLEKLKS